MLVLLVGPVAIAASQSVAQKAASAGQAGPNQNPNRDLIYWKASPDSVTMLMHNIPQKDVVRLEQLRQTFFDLQCRNGNLQEMPFPGGKNLLCRLPAGIQQEPGQAGAVMSEQAGTILLIAHYSHTSAGEAAVENWSGAMMLPFLYHALSASPRRHTFLFAEVDGETGARAFFDSLTPDERRMVRGVVALDALGLGPVQFYSSSNDANGAMGWFWLPHQLEQAALDIRYKQLGYGIPGIWLKTDVTREFRHHGIPSLLIHSVSFATRHVPGSVQDTAEAIDAETYLQTLDLLSDYVVELDRPWPRVGRAPASTPSRGRRR
jgi:hypothetical protein